MHVPPPMVAVQNSLTLDDALTRNGKYETGHTQSESSNATQELDRCSKSKSQSYQSEKVR